MSVFTPEFIAQLTANYARMPEHLRPLLYQVACAPHNAGMRAEIEGYVAELHPDDAPQYVERLQKSKAQGPAFQNTYHELVTGHLLRSLGFAPRYDQSVPVDGKVRTPDWDVPATPECPRFLCDVFTANPEEQRAKHDAGLRDLTSRVNAIPLGAILMIETEPDAVHDVARNAATARHVERWLADGAAPGASTSADGFTFFAVRSSSTYTHVQVIGPATSFWGDNDPLTDEIAEKVAKYAGAGLPFAVAIFANFFTAVGVDEIERAITGGNGRPGVFSHEALSAILWITGRSGAWRLRAFCNPNARQRLDERLCASST
jgi:hypothetical protein